MHVILYCPWPPFSSLSFPSLSRERGKEREEGRGFFEYIDSIYIDPKGGGVIYI